jgi:xanthine/uracil permease
MWLGLAIMLAVLGLIVWATMLKSSLGHWVRVAVMILSFGMIFPNAMTEDIDIPKHDVNKDTKVKKQ